MSEQALQTAQTDRRYISAMAAGSTTTAARNVAGAPPAVATSPCEGLLPAVHERDAFAHCLHNGSRGEPLVLVHTPATGPWPIRLRPGTTDARVFLDTFEGLFHLPEVQLPDDAVILDLGANIGLTALHYARLFPRSRIVAVEIDAGNVAAMRENVRPVADRVTIVHAAVWDTAGTVRYGGCEEWGFSIEGSGAPWAASTAHSVPALTIDAIMDAAGIDRADFVKIDIEGAEARVLAPDARPPAWLRRVRHVQVEVHAPATVEGIWAALTRAGLAARRDTRHWACVNASAPGA